MKTREIYLGGSTIYGGADFLSELPGVDYVEFGMMGTGNDVIVENISIARPTTYHSSSNARGATQVLKVVYDADVIPLATLLEAYFETIDPFARKEQIDYSGGMPTARIFFVDAQDELIADTAVVNLQKQYDMGAVTVEVMPATSYSPLVEYERDYVKRDANEGWGIVDGYASEFVSEHAGEFGI